MVDQRSLGIRSLGVLVLGLLLLSCGGSDTPSLLTPPRGGDVQSPPAPGSVLPFGAPPVSAPAALRGVASRYYDGAGPAPNAADSFRPACLLMLPTALRAVPVRAVPTARFNVFDEFEVAWGLAAGHGNGLALFVYPPGDPSDREFFAGDASVTSLVDQTELRTSPHRPRATLIRVPTQNCEYELEGHGPVSPVAVDTAVHSLRLIFVP